MTYNKNVKKYIKQCKYLFASYGKSEKEYISKLIDNIDDGSHDSVYLDREQASGFTPIIGEAPVLQIFFF